MLHDMYENAEPPQLLKEDFLCHIYYPAVDREISKLNRRFNQDGDIKLRPTALENLFKSPASEFLSGADCTKTMAINTCLEFNFRRLQLQLSMRTSIDVCERHDIVTRLI